MSSHLSLSPAELDRIEDALEDLELDDFDPAAFGGDDDPVAQRLVELRGLLQLSREALPLEEVPAGLLDGVLAEAQQAASAARTPGGPEPERGSWWSRWRLGVWVPGLAFAGSAALLLLVLGPSRDSGGEAEDAVAKAEPSAAVAVEASAEASNEATDKDGRLAQAQLDPVASAPEGDEDTLRGQGLAIGERAPDPEPAAEPSLEPPTEEAEEAADDEAQTRHENARRKATSGSSSAGASPKPAPPPKTPASSSGKKGGAALPSGPMPTTKPTESKTDAKDAKKDEGDGTDLWPEISRADADRRGGNCGLAKMRYDKARKADDGRVRARALAGLGLCEAADGSMGTAKKLFAQARAADPEVSRFIDGELAALDGPDQAARE